MRALGSSARQATRVYFTGGASAVLLGWRTSTIDVDIAILPDSDELLRAIPRLKTELELNVELASPADFLPALPGWEDRSVFIAREGQVSFLHYDFCAQALAKIERDHVLDRSDVQAMLRHGLVAPEQLRALHAAIEPELYRYPAVDPHSLRAALARALETP
jgi:uncharacterized nucleotidyltransferase DUF6036